MFRCRRVCPHLPSRLSGPFFYSFPFILQGPEGLEAWKNKMRSLRFFFIAALLLGGAFEAAQEPRIERFLSAPIYDGIVLTPDLPDALVWKSAWMTLPQGMHCAISMAFAGGGNSDVFFETSSGETTRHLRIFEGSDRHPWRAVLQPPASSCRLVLKQAGILEAKPVFERVEIQSVPWRYYYWRTAAWAFRSIATVLGIAAFLWGCWLARPFLKNGLKKLQALLAAGLKATGEAVKCISTWTYPRLKGGLKRVLFEPSAELERGLVLLGFGGWLFWPLFAPKLSGGSDAAGYVALLADTLEQARHGVFPVWVGQSPFSFTGLVFPLRYAPMYQHLGLLIDFLTFHSLSVFAINASILVLSGLGGLGVCYAALRNIAPDRPWLAMLLSWIYVSCPGVYGFLPIYSMYMSWVALPWLPLAFWGMARSLSLRRPDLLSKLLQAIGLALLLWCHSPLAMWSMIAAVAVNVWRMIYFRPKLSEYLWDAGAGALFIVLALHPLLSVYDLGRTLSIHSGADLNEVYSLIIKKYSHVLIPLPKGLGFQPGFAVLVLFVLGCWGLGFKENRRHLPLGFLAIIFVALLLPIPWFSHWLLFHVIPPIILNINRRDLDQRLDTMLAITAVFLVAGVSKSLLRHGSSSKTSGRLIVLLAGALLFWTVYQVNFLREIQSTSANIQSEWFLKRGYTAFGNLFTNPYFDYTRYDWGPQPVAPEMELRLLDPEASKIVSSNIESVAPGYGPASEFRKMRLSIPLMGSLVADGETRSVRSPQTFILEPDKQYLLAFSLLKPNPDFKGKLIISGDGGYQPEEYDFNGNRGEWGSRAWGSGSESSHVIALQSFLDHPTEIDLTLRPSDPSLAKSFTGHYADCELIEYQKENLPIRIDSFIPFRARVRNPAAGWLETFRRYLPGYDASVDGRPAEIKPSHDGLVLIKMPAGEHRVELNYNVAPKVEFAYFLNLGVFAFVLIGMILFRKRLV